MSSRLMTITIAVDATGNSDKPVEISCDVVDESGLDEDLARTMAKAAIAKVARDNDPEEGS